MDHFSGNHGNKLQIEMAEAGTNGFLMNKSNKLGKNWTGYLFVINQECTKTACC